MEFLYKNGWYFLLIAVIGEMLVPFLLAPFYKGYDHSAMAISSLGNIQSPVRVPFNIWMLIAGIMLILSIPGLYSSYRVISKTVSLIMAVFVGIFAVGACIFSCFFSVNESKDIITTASIIHGAGSAVGFMLLLFVPLLLTILAFQSGDNSTGIISMGSFILALIFFTLFIMADKPAFQNTIIAKEGLWQRFNLFFMYLPLAWIALNHIYRMK